MLPPSLPPARQDALRALALGLMAFDHAAALWLDGWGWRLPGRVVFPLFA